jgi:hypothetical protein
VTLALFKSYLCRVSYTMFVRSSSTYRVSSNVGLGKVINIFSIWFLIKSSKIAKCHLCTHVQGWEDEHW